MTNESIQKKIFTRRAFVLGACKAGLIAGLFGRMFYLQILNHHKFVKLAENNYIKTILIPPLRGQIFDRNSNPLATNQQNYQLCFEKLELHSQDNIYEIALKLGDILELSPQQLAELINQLNDSSLGEEIIIAQDLTWLQLSNLETNLFDLEGISLKTGFNRFYPYAALFGHLTGYIGTISDKEILKSSIAIYPNLKIGKNGLEKTQEKALHGVTGLRRIEVNAKGQPIRKITNYEGVKGQDIKLSVDLKLQEKATDLLKGSTGVILLAKLSTGEILTSVSLPSFDPNLFNNGISSSNWNSLIKDPDLPLIDRTIALTYPPGSGFKVNVALAALKKGFDPETKFLCPGYYTLGNRKFKCWNKHGHGSINLYHAIAGSCNVYFWNVAKIIGIQSFADTARLMGYDQKLLNNSLPREQSGIIPDPSWKEKHVGSNWNSADTLNAAIGQGYVEATPIQMLTMIARIATGRKLLPTIIKSKDVSDFESLDLDKELAIIKKGMTMTVNNDMGTAYSNRIINKELAMAGKTGTSQVISKRHDNDDLSNANIVKKIRNHGIFLSYAPLIDPKYAFCGIVEHGGTPTLAVKIANELLTEAQLRNI